MGRVSRLRARVRRLSNDQVVDGAYLAGMAAIVIGCAWVYGPLGFIVAGALLVRTASILGSAPVQEQPSTKVVERWYSTGDDVAVDEDDA